jgi:4-amino-4-deoxy-L-arabinose transferase-like glycosyltransferase
LGRKAAIFSVLSLLSSLHFLFQFRLAVPDPYLVFCIVGAVFAFQFGLEKSKQAHLFLGYTLTGLGCLAKGPVALGLVGLIMLLYLIFSRQFNWSTLRRLQIPLGAIWFLLLAVPWYVLVGQATNGEWLEGFFFTHNMQRFSSAMEGHGGGFWVTWLFVIGGMLPFILFLPDAIRTVWKEKVRAQPFLLLCLIAAITIIGFFTLSTTKLPNYTVPAYPFLAVLLGYYLSKVKRLSLGYFVVIVLIGMFLPIAVYFGLSIDPSTNSQVWVAALFIPLALGTITSFFFHIWYQTKAAIISLAIGFQLTALAVFAFGLPPIFKQNPVEQSLSVLEDKEEIVTYKQFNPAYLFNLERTFQNFDSPRQLRQYLQAHPDTYVLTQTRYLKDFRKSEFVLMFEQKDLFEKQTSVVLQLNTQR